MSFKALRGISFPGHTSIAISTGVSEASFERGKGQVHPSPRAVPSMRFQTLRGEQGHLRHEGGVVLHADVAELHAVLFPGVPLELLDARKRLMVQMASRDPANRRLQLEYLGDEVVPRKEHSRLVLKHHVRPGVFPPDVVLLVRSLTTRHAAHDLVQLLLAEDAVLVVHQLAKAVVAHAAHAAVVALADRREALLPKLFAAKEALRQRKKARKREGHQLETDATSDF
eukprot:scaffold529_cov308-Pinguiococcus_pyrenoidosus.AAC.68